MHMHRVRHSNGTSWVNDEHLPGYLARGGEVIETIGTPDPDRESDAPASDVGDRLQRIEDAIADIAARPAQSIVAATPQPSSAKTTIALAVAAGAGIASAIAAAVN